MRVNTLRLNPGKMEALLVGPDSALGSEHALLSDVVAFPWNALFLGLGVNLALPLLIDKQLWPGVLFTTFGSNLSWKRKTVP